MYSVKPYILKNFLLIFCVSFLFLNCEDSFDGDDGNNCLQDKNVNVTLNLNLPSFGDLQFTGGSDFIRDEVSFIKGVYIQNLGGGEFLVLELAEPNDCLQVCDVATSLTDGEFVYECGDETRSYSLLGNKRDKVEGEFDMRRYGARLSQNGQLTISF